MNFPHKSHESEGILNFSHVRTLYHCSGDEEFEAIAGVRESLKNI